MDRSIRWALPCESGLAIPRDPPDADALPMLTFDDSCL